jgi:hypothetical protein
MRVNASSSVCVCVCVCVHKCNCVSPNFFMSVGMFKNMRLCINFGMHVCVCACVCVCVCVCIYMCVCMYDSKFMCSSNCVRVLSACMCDESRV